uniref:Uncharacterized protein n=1 Tax=Anguilla anguilla TaxID=7936 RepID=A0A0E9REL6_ANGAN
MMRHTLCSRVAVTLGAWLMLHCLNIPNKPL